MDFETSNLVRLLTYKPEERMALFMSLSIPERSAIFSILSPYVQQSILKQLKNAELVDMLDNMDMLHVEQILSRIPEKKRRQKIIAELKGEVKQKIEYFLRFHPDASFSHINFNYLFLSHTSTVGEAANLIDEFYAETGRYPEILVHSDGLLIGEVPFASLVRERNSSLLNKHVKPVQVISYQANIPEIITVLSGTNSKKIVVLDSDESVLGIIYAEAIKPLFADLPAESLYDFTGVDDSERPFDAISKKIKSRHRWLILNLATCFLAGSVILIFQGTLDQLTILSVYIPIIAGMAGNAASQSFAITVRGITLGIISLRTAMPAIMREAGAGAVNGFIIGTIVFFISAVWNGNPLLGLVVGFAIMLAQTIAVVSGALIPLILKYYGKDPASTSSIFITTVTDVCGLLLLFGLSTLFLL